MTEVADRRRLRSSDVGRHDLSAGSMCTRLRPKNWTSTLSAAARAGPRALGLPQRLERRRHRWMRMFNCPVVAL